MATVQMTGPKFTINGSNVYKLGGSSNESDAGGVLIHIVNDGTLSATITVQGAVPTVGNRGGGGRPTGDPVSLDQRQRRCRDGGVCDHGDHHEQYYFRSVKRDGRDLVRRVGLWIGQRLYGRGQRLVRVLVSGAGPC